MIESKFLKQSDLDYENGNLVTIKKLDQQNVGVQDQEEELKWVVHFKEFQKGMVLNSTNIQLITKALGTEETEDWIGKRVVIFVDDNVSFGGKLVGGIRIRKVRGQAAQSPKADAVDRQNRQIKEHAATRTMVEDIADETPPW